MLYVLSCGHIVIHCWCFEVLGIVWTLAYMRDKGLMRIFNMDSVCCAE